MSEGATRSAMLTTAESLSIGNINVFKYVIKIN